MLKIINIVPALIVLASTPALAQEAQGTFVGQDGLQLGSVTLTTTDSGVAIAGEIIGLTPGEHGIHFHATGDCNGADGFESAGDHFNPTAHQHGLNNPQGPHGGDLPNITADAQGTASIALTSNTVSLSEGAQGYVFDADGTALVIHADPDDNRTDPSGNSGERIACAVIEAAPAS